MHHDVEILSTPDDVARAAAQVVAERIREASDFTLAVSGGRTPAAMLHVLAGSDTPWDRARVYQVDERVAPEGDPDRNLTMLRAALADVPVDLVPMPVDDPDLDAAAARYAAFLPDRLDLVHLGLGSDGHTASLVPNDPVLEARDRLVAVTGEYQGRRRMTLTYPALARADQLLWLVTGGDKRDALRALLAGDRSIPAGRVEAARSLVMADEAAAGT